ADRWLGLVDLLTGMIIRDRVLGPLEEPVHSAAARQGIGLEVVVDGRPPDELVAARESGLDLGDPGRSEKDVSSDSLRKTELTSFVMEERTTFVLLRWVLARESGRR